MTNEQKRIRIAELMGWKVKTYIAPYEERSVTVFLKPGKTDIPSNYGYGLPDWLGSLDACAEFEATLTTEELSEYVEELASAIFNPEGDTGAGLRLVSGHIGQLVTATALQRCDAFLWTKGIAP